MDDSKKRKYLPYIIAIFIIGILLIIISTYILYLMKENNGCRLNRNIWCYTDFKCAGCEEKGNCEENIKSLILPESRLAQFCYGGEGNSNVSECLCMWAGNTSLLGNRCIGDPMPVNSLL